MGETPDMWNESWFTAVEEGGMMFHLDSLMEFQKKFRKAINPVTVKPWNYKFIFANPDWPGWQKLPYLAQKGVDDVHIETAVAPLKEYLVFDDKNAAAIKVFFDGEPEEPVEQPKPNFDIGEFGKIGDISWDGPDVDDSDINLDGLSKEARAMQAAEQARVNAYTREVDSNVKTMEKLDIKAEHRKFKEPLGDVRIEANNRKRGPKQEVQQGTAGSVQDTLFDYLDEMLQKNVLSIEKQGGEIEEPDDM